MRDFIPRRPEKEVISIRMDSEMLRTVDREANEVNISRNEFINQCISFALEHLPEDEE